MAPRVIKQLTNLQIDEVSLVDRGANQHASVVISKRMDPEMSAPTADSYFEPVEKVNFGGMGTKVADAAGAVHSGVTGAYRGLPKAGKIGVVGAGAVGAGLVVHHHYNTSKSHTPTADDYFRTDEE